MMENVIDAVRLDAPEINHIHLIVPDSASQGLFVQELRENIENSKLRVVDTDCLGITNQNELYSAIVSACTLSEGRGKAARTPADLVTSVLDSAVLKVSDSRGVLCLLNVESLSEVKAAVLKSLFDGFGDREFQRRIKLVTLSHLPIHRCRLGCDFLKCISFNLCPQSGKHSSTARRVLEIYRTRHPDESPEKLEKNFPYAFVKACSTYLSGHTTDDPRRIYFLICEVIMKHPDILESSTGKWEPLDIAKYFTVSDAEAGRDANSDFVDERNILAMPDSTKYVLMAAFCAGFNRRPTDPLIFCKSTQHTKARSKPSADNPNFESGPRPFGLARVQAIALFFLFNFHGDIRVDIVDKLAQLIRMGFVVRVSSAANLAQPKFNCNVDYEFIFKVAKSLELDMSDFIDGKPPSAVATVNLTSGI